MKKKILIFSMSLLLIGSANAQLTWNPEPSGDPLPFGITVGFSEKYMTGTNFGGKKVAWAQADAADKMGETVRFGFTYNPEFGYGIGLLTGLYYEWTPSVYNTEPVTNVKIKTATNAHDLILPLRIQWRYELMENISLFAYTGPSFECGLDYSTQTSWFYDGTLEASATSHAYSGRWENSVNNDLATVISPLIGGITTGKGQNENLKAYNRFHAFWGVGVGVQLKMFRIAYSADWGLNNINNMSSDADKQIFLNRPVCVTLSYMFGGAE